MIDLSTAPETADQLPSDGTEETTQVVLPRPLEEFLSLQGLVPSQEGERRRFARLYYRRPMTLLLATSLPEHPRPPERVSTYACDLSRTGIAFLSPCELYPRETVNLEVAALGCKQVRVVRCRQLTDRCYEVGGRLIEVAAR